MSTNTKLLALLCLPFGAATPAISAPIIKGWPPQVQDVKYLSAADNTLQPTLFYKPESDKPVPLLVALHTWNSGYMQPESAYAKWCIARGWVFIHPDFRGPNNKPEACGSELMVKDILSAVDYAQKTANIDTDRIYLVGVSGGGHAAMLMAGRAPQVWAGVSAWCGIFDLNDWHRESQARKNNYASMIAKSCGGVPGDSAEVDAEYRKRSPSAWLGSANGVPVDLNTGIFDGHKGSVPVSHTLKAFNMLAAPADRLSDEEIAFITEKSQIPAPLQKEINDPLYARGKALFRRISNAARVTVFNGGHEIIHEAALAWLGQQRKGQPPVWDIKPVSDVNLNDLLSEAGK